MSDEIIRVGIVGCGGIAQHYHVPSYLSSPRFRIVAACDVSDQATESLCQMAPTVESVFGDHREMLEEADVELISICTTNDMHYPVAMDAIAKRVDVYCEKPMALTYTQAREMRDAASAAGIKTGVNFSHRRTPASRLVKEIVASGVLGDIYYVSAVYAAGWPDYAQRPFTWRNDKAQAGFGGLGDMGSHMIDMVLWWLGTDVRRVAAAMRTFVPRRMTPKGDQAAVTTEDQGTALLEYANGAQGYLCGSYTFTGRGYDQRAEIYGANGGLLYDQQHPFELQIFLPADALARYTILTHGGTRDKPYTTILVPERLHGPSEPTERRTVLTDFMAAYLEEPFAFSPTFDDGCRVQEVLEAIGRADTAGCWISLPL